MSSVRVQVGDEVTTVVVDDQVFEVPIGVIMLCRTELQSDPPRPEELTNAIGLGADYFDDLVRDAPQISDATSVQVAGREIAAIASVEAGYHVDLPFDLNRDAAEDVFRTLATETAGARALNPGLDAHLVSTVVGGCCVLVALFRRLHLDSVEVVA